MKIFVISLKRSVERRTVMQNRLDELGVNFEFFDAIDGHAEPPHPLFSKYDYFKRLWLTNGRQPSKGEMGCYASHYSLWQKCVVEQEPILIIEDDAYVNENIVEQIDNIVKLVNKFGFLRLEVPSERCKLFSKEKSDAYEVFFMDNNFDGTRSYALTPAVAKCFMQSSATWCMPVDNFIGSLYMHKVPSYLFTPAIVENQGNFDTTIQLGQESRPPVYRKLTREVYAAYRKYKMNKFNRKYQ